MTLDGEVGSAVRANVTVAVVLFRCQPGIVVGRRWKFLWR
jgi:hypothetical protein